MALNSNTELCLINTTINSGSITLPACVNNQGRIITFKDSIGQFGTNTLTLVCSGSDTFEDGGTSKVLRESYGSIQLVASGTKWYILNGTQVNTLQLSTLNAITISSVNLSTINTQISSLNFIDNRNSTNTLIGSISSVSTQAVSTNFLYYNNYIIAGTRVGYSNLINRYTSNFINPYIIPGLVLWLDGADRNTLFIDNGITPAAVGQSIFRWSDKSPSGNHATQSGAVGLRPVLSTDPTTSNTDVSFTQSATQSMNLSATLLPIGTADATYFIVLRATQPLIQRYIGNIFSYGTAGEVGTIATGKFRLFVSAT